MNTTEIVVGKTGKKKFFLTLLSGLTLFGIIIGIIGFSGRAFALPLGGMGDFHVHFDKLEGEAFELNPKIGETGEEDAAPLVRNNIGTATIDNLHIFKDLKMPIGGWVRINITASEPSEITGLIQDARFIDANLIFDDMSIKETNTSGMSPEEAFQLNWSHDAETVTITDAEIVTDYLFQEAVALNGAKISLEQIDEPNLVSDESDNNSLAARGDSSDGTGKLLPTTMTNVWFYIIGSVVLITTGAVVLLIRKKILMKQQG